MWKIAAPAPMVRWALSKFAITGRFDVGLKGDVDVDMVSVYRSGERVNRLLVLLCDLELSEVAQ